MNRKQLINKLNILWKKASYRPITIQEANELTDLINLTKYKFGKRYYHKNIDKSHFSYYLTSPFKYIREIASTEYQLQELYNLTNKR